MAVNSGDFVQAAGLLNNLVEQANGDLEHLDMSLYISVGKNYDRESGGGAVTLQSKSITKTPTRQQQQQTVYPDPGFDGLSSVGVTVEAIPSDYVIPSGSVNITQNGTVDVSGKAQAIVNVPTGGGEPSLQQKSVTVTPTTQQQQQTVTPDSGFDGLSSVGVTVEAIPSEYIIPSGSVTITQNGTVNVAGKEQAIVNVPTSGGAITGTFQGNGARSITIPCPREPSVVFVKTTDMGDDVSYLGCVVIIIIRDDFTGCVYDDSSTAASTKMGYSRTVNGLSSTASNTFSGSYDAIAQELTLTAYNNAARLFFNANCEYNYIIY